MGWFAYAAGRGETAFRNASLQGGYLTIAARALGLDVGPMSGFDAAGVKAEFFPDSNVEPNYILNLGYGSDENLFARSPRLSFDEAAQIL
jgi:3-hydroxypropanoate dehydrogenase